MKLALFAIIIALGLLILLPRKHFKKPCNHGASSVAGVFKTVHGKRVFVVTQAPHKTGC